MNYKNTPVALNLTPGTQYKLALAGFSFYQSMGDPVQQILCGVELIRICSGTTDSADEVAENLESLEGLQTALIALIDQTANEKPAPETESGKV